MADTRFFPPLRKKNHCTVVTATTEILLGAEIENAYSTLFLDEAVYEFGETVIFQKGNGQWCAFIFYFEAYQHSQAAP